MSEFEVHFDDGTDFYITATTFAEEGNLTYFYDDVDRIVGAVVTVHIKTIRRRPEKVAIP